MVMFVAFSYRLVGKIGGLWCCRETAERSVVGLGGGHWGGGGGGVDAVDVEYFLVSCAGWGSLCDCLSYQAVEALWVALCVNVGVGVIVGPDAPPAVSVGQYFEVVGRSCWVENGMLVLVLKILVLLFCCFRFCFRPPRCCWCYDFLFCL